LHQEFYIVEREQEEFATNRLFECPFVPIPLAEAQTLEAYELEQGQNLDQQVDHNKELDSPPEDQKSGKPFQ
jgi:hypothetical protein